MGICVVGQGRLMDSQAKKLTTGMLWCSSGAVVRVAIQLVGCS